MDEKQLLRTGVCTARASRPAVDRAADGTRLAAYAGELLALATTGDKRAGTVVAAYAGVADEPPTQALLDALANRGAHVMLPVTTGDGTLDWASYEGWDRLVTARWGLLEPATARLGVAAIESADLVVVPALAVDPSGHRLGRGGGFYDRALGAVRRDKRVAVVYDGELVDAVPTEPHDQEVGWVLTPAGLTELVGG